MWMPPKCFRVIFLIPCCIHFYFCLYQSKVFGRIHVRCVLVTIPSLHTHSFKPHIDVIKTWGLNALEMEVDALIRMDVIDEFPNHIYYSIRPFIIFTLFLFYINHLYWLTHPNQYYYCQSLWLFVYMSVCSLVCSFAWLLTYPPLSLMLVFSAKRARSSDGPISYLKAAFNSLRLDLGWNKASHLFTNTAQEGSMCLASGEIQADMSDDLPPWLLFIVLFW